MSPCDRCGRWPGEILNLRERLCHTCMDAELATAGVDIWVQLRPGWPGYVINTVRDAETVFLPDGYTTGGCTLTAEELARRAAAGEKP